MYGNFKRNQEKVRSVMVKEVNRLIREKIKKKEKEDEVLNDFLMKLFIKELEHNDRDVWRFGDTYQRIIDEFSEKWEDKK